MVGAVDIGTNTVRVLVLDGGKEVVRREVITRLGEGVDRDGVLSPEAMDRTVAALARFRPHLDRCDRVRIVATSASRDAANRESFFDQVAEATGHRPQLIEGGEEAGLAFRGAVEGLGGEPPFLVIDVGGGSTELVYGSSEPEFRASLQVGSVRLTERLIFDRPAGPMQVDVALAHVIDRVVEAEVPPGAETVMGVAGTVTSLAAIALGLEAFDPQAVHGSVLASEELGEMVERLATLTVEETAAIPSLEPARAPVLLGGAVVTLGCVRALELDSLTVSVADLLDGAVLSLLPE